MKRLLSTIVIVAILSSGVIQACSCFYLPFCDYYESLTENSSRYSLVVATRGDMTMKGMKFSIIQTLEGESIGDQPDINMSVGTSCEISRDGFIPGERYLMLVSIHRIDNTTHYSLNPCASHALRINGSILEGHIADGVNDVSLEEFLVRSDCPTLVGLVPKLDAYAVADGQEYIGIFFRDVTTGQRLGLVDYTLYSMAGQEVYTGQHSTLDGPLRIDTSGMPAGMYMIRLTALTEQQTLKILKM